MNNAALPTDTLGHRVRAVRRTSNVTQKELAKNVGCSQQTVVDLEAGKVEYSRFTKKIAEELKVALHWLETGEGSRDRPGRSQGRVAVVSWDQFLSLVDGVGEGPRVTDWLESCPVASSGNVAMVIVDERTAFVMGGRVKAGDWLFVDRERFDDGLVVATMPGWHKVELRELTTIGGRRFLAALNRDVPDRMTAVSPQRNYDAYTALAERNDADVQPALILGRVIFRGQPEN